MTGTLIDENENSDILTGEELIAAQAAIVKIREKRFAEETRSAMRIKEMREREKIKAEREERRAARKAEEKAAAAERRRVQMKEKKEAAAYEARIKLAGATDKARERANRDAQKAAALEAAREARSRDRAFRDAERAAARENDNDTKAAKLLKKNQELGSGPFANWAPVEMLGAIVEKALIDDKNQMLGPMGVAVIDSKTRLAVAIDHPAIMKKLDCPAGYHLVLRQHPRCVDTSRAVWFGDRLERCIVFSLPVVGGGNA